MSLKQKEHSEQYHYVNALEETDIPSNVTPLEELGIELVDPQDNYSDEDADDELTTDEIKKDFFSLIRDLKTKFPTYTPEDFKKYLNEDEEMSKYLKELQEDFKNTFVNINKNDPEYINILIGLSEIGIEIPRESLEEVKEDNIEIQLNDIKIKDE